MPRRARAADLPTACGAVRKTWQACESQSFEDLYRLGRLTLAPQLTPTRCGRVRPCAPAACSNARMVPAGTRGRFRQKWREAEARPDVQEDGAAPRGWSSAVRTARARSLRLNGVGISTTPGASRAVLAMGSLV